MYIIIDKNKQYLGFGPDGFRGINNQAQKVVLFAWEEINKIPQELLTDKVKIRSVRADRYNLIPYNGKEMVVKEEPIEKEPTYEELHDKVMLEVTKYDNLETEVDEKCNRCKKSCKQMRGRIYTCKNYENNFDECYARLMSLVS